MSDAPVMVSVLCTAYNHEKYLREALDSMVNQETDFAYEILVSDDVSTDSTPDIIREYAARYPDKVRPFLMTENLYSQGRDVYYEVFFPNARGKYTAFCEGDDCWTDPTKLQRQVDFLEAPRITRPACTTRSCSSTRARERTTTSSRGTPTATWSFPISCRA